MEHALQLAGDVSAGALTILGNQGPTDGPAVTPTESFVLPDIDDDLRADFAAIGIDLSIDPQDGAADDFAALEQAKREALAAMLLRRVAQRDRELEAAQSAFELEVQILTQHYDRRMAGARRDREACIRFVEHLALLSAEQGGFGRKKSADTPWGTFGIRERGASVECTDKDALIKHYAQTNPLLVSVTAKLPLSRAKLLMSEGEIAAAKVEPVWNAIKKTLDPNGTLPPGVVKVEPMRVAYAEPRTPFTGEVAA